MTPCTPLQAALHRKRLAERKKKKKATSSNATGADSLEEVLTKRLHLQEYLNQYFDPEHELRMQYKRMGKDTHDIDWKRVKCVSPDFLYISSTSDML